jgi:hypothetical protein
MNIKLLAKQIRHYFIPKGMFAVILNLILHKANRRQWNLNIGSYLLRKGVGWEIGQIIKKEPLNTGATKVTYITGFSYDFEKNKVIHRTGVKVIK